MNAHQLNSRRMTVNMVDPWALYPLKKAIPASNMTFIEAAVDEHQDVYRLTLGEDQAVTKLLEDMARVTKIYGTKHEEVTLLQAMREPGNHNRGADAALIFRHLGVGASKACGKIRVPSLSLRAPATDARLHSAPPCAKLACAHPLTPARLYSAKLRGWSRSSSRPG
jgi:hypothetical protein